jgi:hypothetical protein
MTSGLSWRISTSVYSVSPALNRGGQRPRLPVISRALRAVRWPVSTGRRAIDAGSRTQREPPDQQTLTTDDTEYFAADGSDTTRGGMARQQ